MYKLEDIMVRESFEKNKEMIRQMEEKIKNGNVSFVLGAGVSISAGFPNWQGLLAEMIGRLLYTYNKSDINDIVSNVPEKGSVSKLYKLAREQDGNKFAEGADGKYSKYLNGINLLEIAEYLLNYHLGTLPHDNDTVKSEIAERQVASLVHACLYKDENELRAKLKEGKGKSTLDAIAHVIASKFGKGKNRQDIITYNYDNLLEYSLLDREISLEEDPSRDSSGKIYVKEEDMKSISYTDADKQLEENKINICHIHGKINVTGFDQPAERLILSESSYHDIEAVDYKWIHMVQANAMLNSTCLFAGFSAEDYNFRRIIRKSEKTEHCYILFAVNDFVQSIFGEIVEEESKKTGQEKRVIYKRIFGSDQEYQYEKLMLAFLIDSKTTYWERQNIKPIWTTWKEMPALIEELAV